MEEVMGLLEETEGRGGGTVGADEGSSRPARSIRVPVVSHPDKHRQVGVYVLFSAGKHKHM